jgi:cell wall-associated NlpC family hydrolase
MNIAKLTKKVLIASMLGLSLLAAPVLGSAGIGQASAASVSVSYKADQVIQEALNLKGKVRYKYGVNRPSSYTFDCSSFTKYVFSKAGVTLPWSSRLQAQQGKYVSKSSLQAGDLVFFKSSGSSSNRITHVGIYMGDGKFIHNTIGGSVNGVIISDLSDYSHRYVTARRIL